MAKVMFSGQIVFCDDVEASAKFYENVLGFRRAWDDAFDVCLTAPVKDSADATVAIMLHQKTEQEGVAWTFAVDDVDAFIAEAEARGCEIGMRPTDEPWGVRHADLKDPDGYVIDVTGPLQKS